MNAEYRYEELCNYGIYEIEGKFQIIPSNERPIKTPDNSWSAGEIFDAQYRWDEGRIDANSWNYPDELLSFIPDLPEYNEWKELLASLDKCCGQVVDGKLIRW